MKHIDSQSMAARLRMRFFMVALGAFTACILLVTALVNVLNVATTLASLDAMAASIISNQGALPDFQMMSDQNSTFFMQPPFSKETEYMTRYFSVVYTSDGTVLEANLSHIASVSSDNLYEYVEKVGHVTEGFGSVGDYRYAVEIVGTVKYAVFLDASQELFQMRLFATISVIVGIIADLFVGAMVWVLSPRAIEPLVQANLRQRRFITDASHELKTPLTIMRTSLALARTTSGDNKWLDKCDVQAQKLTDLINDLIVLSRLEESQMGEASTFDLTAAAQEVASTYEEVSDKTGRALELHVADDLMFTGDETGIRRLLGVLLENAFKHASGDGPVVLTVSQAKTTTTISCANPAAVLDEDACSHLFDRFWRPDESRNASTGGFGIGLSIAKTICDAHGATISARMADGGDLEITAVFPHTRPNGE